MGSSPFSAMSRPYGQAVKTSPSHGGIPGSNPGRVISCLVRGPVVQMVRMPACHAGGRGFEAHPGRNFIRASTQVAKGDGL